jgi:uncharacterized protein
VARQASALAAELNFGVRCRSVLPLGRAARSTLQPGFISLSSDSDEAVNNYMGPRISCSLGQNLHVAVDGACYPCFALMGERHFLGNVFDDRLNIVLERNAAYTRHTVDTNQQCRQCAWRYLCGGFCRVWSCSQDPDAPPRECAALQSRAGLILRGALEVLKVSSESWQAAGLPYIAN